MALIKLSARRNSVWSHSLWPSLLQYA